MLVYGKLTVCVLQTLVTWNGDTLVAVQKGEKANRGWKQWIEGDLLHLVTERKMEGGVVDFNGVVDFLDFNVKIQNITDSSYLRQQKLYTFSTFLRREIKRQTAINPSAFIHILIQTYTLAFFMIIK